MSSIVSRKASQSEIEQSQTWELWETGDALSFEYSYDRDVNFVVQSGEAVIHSPTNPPVSIKAGDHVTISRGVEGKWAITAPITNRYQYLS